MAADKKGYNILIIEDNPGDFVLVEDFLFDQIEAPVISQAKTFKEAKDILSSGHCKFDIILLDLSLPDKTGEGLILDIIEICANVPVIVLTGYSEFAFGVRSLSLGISDYLLKDGLTSTSLYKSIVYSAERKKNIDDLKESEKRYSDVFHFSPLPMWIVDMDSLKFLDVNRATINHYGYTHDEFLSMTLKDIRPVEEIPNLEHGLAEGMGSPGSLSNNVMIHKKKNGELMSVEIQIAPFQFRGAKVNIVISNDITERLNYIKAIEEQNEKLREISWIQSHIVRAPLARIMGLVPLIKDVNEDDDLKNTMLEYLKVSADELDHIIKDITDITEIVEYKKDPKL
jgi:PAS domain S-box-containing protein